jgi:hypothetical protein
MTAEIMIFGSISLVSKRVHIGNYEKKVPPQRRKNRLWLAYVKFTSGRLHRCHLETRSATGGGTSSYGSIMHYSRKSRPRFAASPTLYVVVTDDTPRISPDKRNIPDSHPTSST